jgi:general secretion pathway protein A
MYRQFFGLKENPFNTTPDPKFLFLTPQHRKALAGLTYAMLSGKHFVVLTGEIGSGKTTLLATALHDLQASRCESSIIVNPTLTPAETLEAILMGFGVTEIPSTRLHRLSTLDRVIQQANLNKKVPALIVDEAHKMSLEVLQEVRLLANIESLQVVLAGQNELNQILNREDLRELRERITLRLSIEPLSPLEVERYIRHRWEKAGGTGPLPFTPEALVEVARSSGAIPRLINSICDNALHLAFQAQVSAVTAGHVLEAVTNLDITNAGKPQPNSVLHGHETQVGTACAMSTTLPLRQGTSRPVQTVW